MCVQKIAENPRMFYSKNLRMHQQSKNPRKWAHIGLLQLMFYSEALQHLPKRLSLQHAWQWRFPMLVRLSTLTVSSFLSPSKWSSISKLFCSAYFLPEEKQKQITNNRTKDEFMRDRFLLLKGPRTCKKIIGKSIFSPSDFFPMTMLTKLFLRDQPRTISRTINFTGWDLAEWLDRMAANA